MDDLKLSEGTLKRIDDLLSVETIDQRADRRIGKYEYKSLVKPLSEKISEQVQNISEKELDEIEKHLCSKHIEIVMIQAACSKKEAIVYLNKHNGDLVNAIMDLTM